MTVPATVVKSVLETIPAAQAFWDSEGKNSLILSDDELNYTCPTVSAYDSPELFGYFTQAGLNWDLQSFLKKCFRIMYYDPKLQASVLRWDQVSSV